MLFPDVTYRQATDCNLVTGAHSVGSPGAEALALRITPEVEYILGAYAHRGQFLLAPELRDDVDVAADLPTLLVVSAAEEDVGTDPTTWYDRRPAESGFGEHQRGSAMVYSWGTEHNAFGGGGAEQGAAAGRAIVDGYVTAFAAAVAFHGETARSNWWSMLTRDKTASS